MQIAEALRFLLDALSTMRTLFIRALLGLLVYAFGAVVGHAQTNKAYCDLKGAVFVVPDVNQAVYRVYLEKSEAFADLPVFKAQNLLYADRSGIWFFTETRAQAAFSIAYVKDRSAADFSIFITDNEAFAGCK